MAAPEQSATDPQDLGLQIFLTQHRLKGEVT